MMKRIKYCTDKAQLLEILRKYGVPIEDEESLYHPFPIYYPMNYILRLLSNVHTDKEKVQIRNMLIPRKEKILEEPTNDTRLAIIPEEITEKSEETLVRSPLKGLTRGYEDRVLISPVGQCAVNCPWCFRTRQSGTLSDEDLERILDYIKNDERIEDVILTGGEPLLFPIERMEKLLKDLRSISHVKIIRFHTRLPIVAPEYFDNKLIRLIGSFNKPNRPIYFVVQIVHPAEIDMKVATLIHKIARQGIPVLNQAPVLRGVNDDFETFKEWLKKMIHAGVKPYYVIVPIIRRGSNDFYSVKYDKVAELVAEYSSQYDGLGRPTIIIPVMGRKMSPLDLREKMMQKHGIHYRTTKIEIWW
jgi:lysine 2,3-aminomutase